MSIKSVILNALSKRGFLLFKKNHHFARYFDLPPRNGLAYALHQTFSDFRNLHFIQVGANDGVRHDPLSSFISDHGWSGTLIEPRLLFIKALKARHQNNPRLRLVHAALTAQKSAHTLYYLDSSIPLPDWTLGLASLDRSRLQKACEELKLPATAIQEEQINGMRWEDLEPETALSKTDVLVLDAEGHDVLLLNLWDWEKAKPPVVHFEHSCSTKEDYLKLFIKLQSFGYEVTTNSGDSTFFLPRSSRTSLPQ